VRIAAVCPTYKRPHLLGRAIHCFLQQTHPDRELVILDDAGQYPTQSGDRWRLVSTPTRYPDFGTKRNAAIDLVSPGTEAILCWDDDDVMWPQAMACAAEALEHNPWAQCMVVLETQRPGLLKACLAHAGVGLHPWQWGYGGCWAYRLPELRALGGYDAGDLGDDVGLAIKFWLRFGQAASSTPDDRPWYWYCREAGTQHISTQGPDFWRLRADDPMEPMPTPPIGWNGPDLYSWAIMPKIQPRPF